MSAAPGRPKQARTAARSAKDSPMNHRAVPKANSEVRGTEVDQ